MHIHVDLCFVFCVILALSQLTKRGSTGIPQMGHPRNLELVLGQGHGVGKGTPSQRVGTAGSHACVSEDREDSYCVLQHVSRVGDMMGCRLSRLLWGFNDPNNPFSSG